MATERIEREILKLEEAIKIAIHELFHAYQSYLISLGEAVRKQLILAVYHLCTQGHPEAFLQLSFSQRQKMQEELRNLGKTAQTSLKLLMQQPNLWDDSSEEDEDEENEDIFDDLEDEDDDNDDDQQKIIVEKLPKSDDTPSENQGIVRIINTLDQSMEDKKLKLNLIEILGKLESWQRYVEKEIPIICRDISSKTNHLLQKTNVLSKKLPGNIIEAISKIENSSTDVIPGVPNLLNLMVEMEGGEPNDAIHNPRLIMAIYLRLSDVEFVDQGLLSSRQQLKQINARLNGLVREYKKKQRERSTIEAESAWRVSWLDEQLTISS